MPHFQNPRSAPRVARTACGIQDIAVLWILIMVEWCFVFCIVVAVVVHLQLL